jgi:hypothetical protein
MPTASYADNAPAAKEYFESVYFHLHRRKGLFRLPARDKAEIIPVGRRGMPRAFIEADLGCPGLFKRPATDRCKLIVIPPMFGCLPMAGGTQCRPNPAAFNPSLLTFPTILVRQRLPSEAP